MSRVFRGNLPYSVQYHSGLSTGWVECARFLNQNDARQFVRYMQSTSRLRIMKGRRCVADPFQAEKIRESTRGER